MQKKQKKNNKKKAPKKSNTHFLGGLENGQEVVPPSLSKKSGFSKSSKTPIFIKFPEKLGGNHFFSKRLCYKEDSLRGGKNDNFLVPFKTEMSEKMPNPKNRGVVGGAKPPQKGREKHSHGRVLVVFVVLCCFFVLVVSETPFGGGGPGGGPTKRV